MRLGAQPLRSLLFAPGDRADLLAKQAATGADAVVADWEDGVHTDRKDEARSVTAAHAASLGGRPGGPWFSVRVNPVGTPWFETDIGALPGGIDGIVVPKVESVEGVHAVRAALDGAGRGDLAVIAGVETVLGVADARAVLAAGVDAAYFGAEDFVADAGGRRSESNVEVLYARSRVAMAARLAGIPAVDQIVAAFRDVARFEREAGEARELGYRGKLCIHPAQVDVANRAFTPSDEEVARAEAVVAAAERGAADGRGVVVVDGMMVDEPLLRQAQAVLALAATSR